jgi:arylsulfatase A-like enzyme
MKKKIWSIIGIFMVMTLVLQSCTTVKHAAQKLFPDNRPNFLIIITDDQRFDTMQYMPKTQEKIFDQGVTFTHGYITTPLCCPSRVGILTGSYAHNTLVRTNTEENINRTIIEDMHAQGYFTGLVGKYLGKATPARSMISGCPTSKVNHLM